MPELSAPFLDPAKDARAALTLDSPEATTALAAALAPVLRAGDVLLLTGDLGSGKTHLARGVIQARLAAEGLFEEVPSPSFTLVQTYQAGALEIWHCDLYRLSSADDLWELGLEEAFSEAACLIEWPDLLAGDWPESAVRLVVSPDPDTPAQGRRIALYAAEGSDLADRMVAVFQAAGS